METLVQMLALHHFASWADSCLHASFTDGTCEVRQAAYDHFGPVLDVIGEDNCVQVLQGTHPSLNGATATIPGLASDTCWSNRVAYLKLCIGIQRSVNPAVFSAHLLPSALTLSKDKVANVRLIAARLLKRLLEDVDNGQAYRNSCIGAVTELGQDADRDVLEVVKSIAA